MRWQILVPAILRGEDSVMLIASPVGYMVIRVSIGRRENGEEEEEEDGNRGKPFRYLTLTEMRKYSSSLSK